VLLYLCDICNQEISSGLQADVFGVPKLNHKYLSAETSGQHMLEELVTWMEEMKYQI
jgi:hypothetical protein